MEIFTANNAILLVIGVLSIGLWQLLVWFIKSAIESAKQLKDAKAKGAEAKTKEQAFLIFKRVRAFKERKKDRYPYYLILACFAIMCAVASATIFLTIWVHFEVQHYVFGPALLLAGIVALVGVVLVFGIFETARQIDRFDDYKAELKKQWPDVDFDA
jgi:hypothetical protein